MAEKWISFCCRKVLFIYACELYAHPTSFGVAQSVEEHFRAKLSEALIVFFKPFVHLSKSFPDSKTSIVLVFSSKPLISHIF